MIRSSGRKRIIHLHQKSAASKRSALDDNHIVSAVALIKLFISTFFWERNIFCKRGQVTGHYIFFHGGAG
jgi:hypothetical protein